jgi:hypothetical protein
MVGFHVVHGVEEVNTDNLAPSVTTHTWHYRLFGMSDDLLDLESGPIEFPERATHRKII